MGVTGAGASQRGAIQVLTLMIRICMKLIQIRNCAHKRIGILFSF